MSKMRMMRVLALRAVGDSRATAAAAMPLRATLWLSLAMGGVAYGARGP